MPWTASRPVPQSQLYTFAEQLASPGFFARSRIQPLLRRESREEGKPNASRTIVSNSCGNRIRSSILAGDSLRKLHGSSHLTSGDELQRSQGNLEVGSVGLEVVESLSNVLLKLGRVLPRRAVGGDLVQGLAAHLDCLT